MQRPREFYLFISYPSTSQVYNLIRDVIFFKKKKEQLKYQA